MPLRTFQVVTFGCKVNQAEGEHLAARLREAGLSEAPPRTQADLVIVNTCAVTAEAARQGRQALRRALRAGARVALTGCGAHPAALDKALEAMSGLDLIEPDKDRLARRLADALGAGSRLNEAARLTPDAGPGRSRALLKVQDGCPSACAYCIVRLVRPEPRSVPIEAAVEEARRLVGAGFHELVLCGIHLGLYGLDLASNKKRPQGSFLPPQGHFRWRQCGFDTKNDPWGRFSGEDVGLSGGLAVLLEALLAVPGLGRVRLSSLEPMEVRGDLLALMAAEPRRLCPHLHLPLQSGDDAVLRRMNRPYGAGEFLGQVAAIRQALDRPAITTDILVGFPGETPAAFENTLRAMTEARFSRVHVFPFSPRPGTPAAAMPDRVPRGTVKERRRRAAALGEALAREYRESLIGREAEVVVERVTADGGAEGLSERYVRVRIAPPLGANLARRALLAVRIVRAAGDWLEAAPEA